MLVRCVGSLAALLLLAVGTASAAPHAGGWQAVEIVAFTDFDDVDVKIGGQVRKAFLVGLRPIRETTRDKDEQESTRRAVVVELRKNELFAQVVLTRGEILGLSVDAFSHRRHGFNHPWDPAKYPYCWTGWGAYNLNTYFLYAKVATFEDHFCEHKHWQRYFAEAVARIEKDRK
jgi:hypothetical protein